MTDEKLSPGENAPEIVDVLIEIPQESGPVKYEVCKESGRLRVDRIIQTAMQYPCHYGYVPSTLSDDGDPCDVLVICPYEIMPGAIISARPIAMLVMEDEAGLDNKILAVPSSEMSSEYDQIKGKDDVSISLLNRIEHFFSHYKDLEKGKWVKLQGWKDSADAIAEVRNSIAAYKDNT